MDGALAGAMLPPASSRPKGARQLHTQTIAPSRSENRSRDAVDDWPWVTTPSQVPISPCRWSSCADARQLAAAKATRTPPATSDSASRRVRIMALAPRRLSHPALALARLALALLALPLARGV